MARLVGLLFFLLTTDFLVASILPLTGKELSLMLRSGYSNEAVLRELAARKFADTLDLTLEKELLKAGATQPLVEALRSGTYQASASEVAIAQEHAEAAQARVTTESAGPQAWNTAPHPNLHREEQQAGTMYDHLKDDLVYWHEGTLVPFDNAALEKKKFYLLFFSAFASKEGRQFTPRLVEYYNRVAPRHPEFEVVFFSADRSQFAMENYISQTSMPWPAVAYDKRSGKAAAVRSNLIQQVPRLFLVNASGEILSDSGDNPPNYDKILADLDKILGGN
jgi:nucleoredoxin